MPELKLYTVADLRVWLMHNKEAEGLNEQVIAPSRAWAIIHNPYVKDDDPVLAAIFEDDELAAYTASFPDILDGQRVWWASTLYCYPKFMGKGYGMIVVGVLKEAHEPELTYDRWGAQETVEIFNHFGYKTTYTIRYHLSNRKINTSSLKGKWAYCAQELQKCMHPWPRRAKIDYTTQYISTIDDETYVFIKAHKYNNLWLREQEMLNWIVQYPFIKGGMDETACVFGADAKIYEYKIAKVYAGKQLQGVYVLRQCDNVLSIVYLYYAEEKRNDVFSSIVNQILSARPTSFVTDNKDLLNYVKGRLYFPKMKEEKVSLSLPNIQQSLCDFTLQLGDGDSFA